MDPKLLETYEKLGIPLQEQKLLAGVAVDAVFDSVSVATTFKGKLAEMGVIFCSFSEAVHNHPELIEKYLGSGLIKGIGPSYAKRLVDAFGTDTLRVLSEEPLRILDVDGIGEVRARRIMEAMGQAQKEGRGAVSLDGRLIDIASIKMAENLLRKVG